MDTERRLENKRMKVAKRMEVSCLETGTSYAGETEDVSDSGIRAYLDKSPKAGANVMVRLFWDEEKKPVESFGRVAWAAEVPIGEGIEVGLMLGAESDVYGKKDKKKKRTVTRYHKFKPTKTRQYVPFEDPFFENPEDDLSIEHNKTVAAIPMPAPSNIPMEPCPELHEGETFKIAIKGEETWAKIISADDIDANGEVRLTVKIKDKYLWKRINTEAELASKELDKTKEVDDFDPEQWKAKPISNAVQSIKRYAAPVVKVTVKLICVSISISAAVGHFAWKKIPLSTRAKILETTDTLRNHKLTAIAVNGVYLVQKGVSHLKRKFAQ